MHLPADALTNRLQMFLGNEIALQSLLRHLKLRILFSLSFLVLHAMTGHRDLTQSL
jgi:uncharacterized membrane protein YagU involved in acid resistance